jgi:hypothetical protein
MDLYPARTMPEYDKTKWRVIVIVRIDACNSPLLKGKLHTRQGIPYTAYHVTSPHSLCDQTSHPPLAFIRGYVPTIDTENIISCVFLIHDAYFSTPHLLSYRSLDHVSIVHKQGDIAVSVDTIRRFTINFKQLKLHKWCNQTDMLLYRVIKKDSISFPRL